MAWFLISTLCFKIGGVIAHCSIQQSDSFIFSWEFNWGGVEKREYCRCYHNIGKSFALLFSFNVFFFFSAEKCFLVLDYVLCHLAENLLTKVVERKTKELPLTLTSYQVSYLVMFAYISVTLGDAPRLSSFYLSSKVWF